MRSVVELALLIASVTACTSTPEKAGLFSDPSRGGGASASTSSEASTAASSSASSTSTSTSTSNSSSSAGGAGGGGGGGQSNNGFPAHWPDGLDCKNEPDVTVWKYDEDTFFLRQSLCTNFEGPFLYLLFGTDKVLLEDTGTGDADIKVVVEQLIGDWLAKKNQAAIELVVAHSHGHSDHVGGDSQFKGLPNTTVVGSSVSAVQTFFGFSKWPTEEVTYELGGRTLDVIAIPGHQTAHIAFYDPRDQLLLTGDTLYPGRLYVSNWSAYQASVNRLVEFVQANHPVNWVLGTHIEMKAAGGDYAFEAPNHPGEHVLELGVPILQELNQAVMGLGNSPSYQAHKDFIIYPL